MTSHLPTTYPAFDDDGTEITGQSLQIDRRSPHEGNMTIKWPGLGSIEVNSEGLFINGRDYNPFELSRESTTLAVEGRNVMLGGKFIYPPAPQDTHSSRATESDAASDTYNGHIDISFSPWSSRFALERKGIAHKTTAEGLLMKYQDQLTGLGSDLSAAQSRGHTEKVKEITRKINEIERTIPWLEAKVKEERQRRIVEDEAEQTRRDARPAQTTSRTGDRAPIGSDTPTSSNVGSMWSRIFDSWGRS